MQHDERPPWAPAAVLFDRDGTLVQDMPYNGDPAAVRPMPGAEAALAKLRAAGIPLGVISNQSGIGRGLLDWPDLFAVQERLSALWAAHGLGWDMALFCPHHPSEGRGCYRRDDSWRKPGSGMIRFAAERLGLDIARSVAVGDRLRDVEAAAGAGVGRVVHVATGHGAAERARVASRFPRTECLPSIAALELAEAPAVAEAARPG